VGAHSRHVFVARPRNIDIDVLRQYAQSFRHLQPVTIASMRIDSAHAYWTPNERTGFLPTEVPSSPEKLTKSHYPSVRMLGAAAAYLGSMADSELSTLVQRLPEEPDVDPESLPASDQEGIVRAYANLATHLIHRPEFALRRELPAQVARPLWAFSRAVDRPPSLTYASYVLANCTSSVSDRVAPNDLQIAQTPSCTPDEEWFVAVHLSIESDGGSVVAAIATIEASLDAGDDAGMVTAIDAVLSTLTFATETMPTVRNKLDADVFRNVIRPLLYGHDKIVFKGVVDEPSITYVGETGAQSGIIRAIDCVLGVRHSEPMLHSMNRFLTCAPPAHQMYFARAAAVGRRLAVHRSPRVQEARLASLRALAGFRRTHLSVVEDYLVPAGKLLSERGTGGTDFRVWLKRLIDETESESVPATQS
jgi:indoleamine 2,3-dioxygenase